MLDVVCVRRKVYSLSSSSSLNICSVRSSRKVFSGSLSLIEAQSVYHVKMVLVVQDLVFWLFAAAAPVCWSWMLAAPTAPTSFYCSHSLTSFHCSHSLLSLTNFFSLLLLLPLCCNSLRCSSHCHCSAHCLFSWHSLSLCSDCSYCFTDTVLLTALYTFF